MRTDNPYKPPTARVADLLVQNATEGVNRHVLRGCDLMWWAFGAAVIGAALRVAFSSDTRLLVARLIGAAIGGGVAFFWTYWVTSKLRAGRNWMRLLITVMQVAGIAAMALFWSFYKPLLVSLYSSNSAYAIATAIQWTLNLLAIALINTPAARAWFAAMKRGGRGSA